MSRHLHFYIHRIYDKAFNKSEHPTAPKGAAGGTGGEFVKKGSTTTGTPQAKSTKPSTQSRTSASGHLPGRGSTTPSTTPARTTALPRKVRTSTTSGQSSYLPGGTKTKTAMQPIPQDRGQWPDHIRKMRIPPAWTNVQYNPDPKGEKLVSGIDSKGRLQTLYSAEHWQKAAAKKYAKVKKIIAKMPDFVKKNNNNLKSRDAKTKQHAEALGLIMETGIRPGSDRDTKATEQAYGITTIQGQHVISEGSKTYLRFVGKDRVHQNIPIDNKELATALRERAKNAGPNGKIFPDINDNSLRRYSRDVTNNIANPKDFRTALGTSMATSLVQSISTPASKRDFKRAVKDVCTSVSQKLGNTPDICFKSYISPYVWEHWEVKYAR